MSGYDKKEGKIIPIISLSFEPNKIMEGKLLWQLDIKIQTMEQK